jgi:hypothetical protein
MYAMDGPIGLILPAEASSRKRVIPPESGTGSIPALCWMLVAALLTIFILSNPILLGLAYTLQEVFPHV